MTAQVSTPYTDREPPNSHTQNFQIENFLGWNEQQAVLTILKLISTTVKQLNDRAYSSPKQVICELRGITQCHLSNVDHPIQVNSPRLTPARKVGTRLTYPGGMEG